MVAFVGWGALLKTPQLYKSQSLPSSSGPGATARVSRQVLPRVKWDLTSSIGSGIMGEA